MTKSRREIPKKIKEEVLLLSEMTCCMCHDRTKPVSFHHIDDNLRNNHIGNLALLCEDCSAKLDQKGKFFKKISPQTIKRYKLDWENKIRLKKYEKTPPLASPMKFEKVLFDFEIRKTVYQINSFPANHEILIQQKIDYLLSIYRQEGYYEQIINALNSISTQVYNDIPKCIIILKSLELFLVHFHSGEAKMTKTDKAFLDSMIEVIMNISNTTTDFNRDPEIIINALSAYDNLFYVLFNNNLEQPAVKIVEALKDLKARCEREIYDKEPFKEGAKMVERYLEKLDTKLDDIVYKWKLVKKMLR